MSPGRPVGAEGNESMDHAAARPPDGINRVAVEPVECIRAGWSLIVDGGRLWTGAGMAAMFVACMFVPYGSLVLLGPAMCGMYYVIFKWIREEQATATSMFKGFEWMWESFAATLLIVIASAVVTMPIVVLLLGGAIVVLRPAMTYGTEPDMGLLLVVIGAGYLFVLFVSMLVRIVFMFSYPLITERGLQPIDAVKWSFRGAWPHLPGLFALSLINSFIAGIGTLMCFLPALLYAPIGMASVVFAQIKIFGSVDRPSFRTFEERDGFAAQAVASGAPVGQWTPIGHPEQLQHADTHPPAEPPVAAAPSPSAGPSAPTFEPAPPETALTDISLDEPTDPALAGAMSGAAPGTPVAVRALDPEFGGAPTRLMDQQRFDDVSEEED